MSSLLDDENDSSSDNEPSFKINKAYADKYDTWRQKEELQKLKDRYGSGDESSSTTSSSSEDEDAEELTPEVERAWLKAFAAVRIKDPKIYSKDVRFFSEKKEDEPKKKKKKEKSETMYLKDYERKVLLEKGGIVDEDESDEDGARNNMAAGPSYFEEQDEIKKSLKAAVSSDSDSDDDLLVRREKTKEEQEAEDDDFHEWMKGQKSTIDDEKAGVELASLKDYWNKPDLDEGEKFLRDYILNKGYIDKDNSRIPSYDEIVNDEDLSDDEAALEKQEAFETKYNFRFEEPDAEFIKSYPRTIQESVRRNDDKRARKRAEIKERKEMEKQRRREELKQLKNLKKKEIMDKLKKLKEITGNATVGFGEGDIDGDFDPDAYDRKMQAAFDDDYYGHEDEDAEKPVFSDSDDDYQTYQDEDEQDEQERYRGNRAGGSRHGNAAGEPHCDDPEFNMDADFDPSAQRERKNKKKKKGKLAEILETEKPEFNPEEKTFEEYLDEYYKLDYDDMVGDTPCRFKYRKVVPNDFGLSIEEILSCPDKELNTWVSLRKTSQYRPEDEEMSDVRRYRARAKNKHKKYNVLVSLKKTEEDEDEPQPGPSNAEPEAKKKKKKKKKKAKLTTETHSNDAQPQTSQIQTQTNSKRKRTESESSPPKKKKKTSEKVRKNKNKKRPNQGLSDERLKAYGINPKKLPYMNVSKKSNR